MEISDAKRASIALQLITEMDNYNNKMWSTNIHNGGDNVANRASAEEMDLKRQQNIAYEYLCHLEEAKKWIEACIKEELPSTTELEENLRNGVYLAKLANFFCPEQVSYKKIFDPDQSKYKSGGLRYKHTDNINHWFDAMKQIGLPKIFIPETTDIYERKNMPRAIYCLHALSLYLYKLGIAPQIQDLYGVAKFTDEEITAMAKELQKYGLQLPAFSKIGGILANEMPFDEAALHAAILAINDAIEKQNVDNTFAALKLIDARLTNINDENAIYYQDVMYDAKKNKSNIAKTKSSDINYVSDVYDELLTQKEIQELIDKVNMEKLLNDISDCINKQDTNILLRLLKSKASPFKGVIDENIDWYMAQLTQEKESRLSTNDSILDRDLVQASINIANKNAEIQTQCNRLIDTLNKHLHDGSKEDFLNTLKNASEKYLPQIDYEYASTLYYIEFKSIYDDKETNLDIDDFIHGIKVLNAIVTINKSIDDQYDYDDNKNQILIENLLNTNAHLQDININLINLYNNLFFKVKEEKLLINDENNNNDKAMVEFNNSLLTHSEIQECIYQANSLYEKEYLGLALLKDSLTTDEIAHTLILIKNLNLNNEKIIDDNAYIYHYELREFLEENQSIDSASVWRVVENCNTLLYNAINAAKVLAMLNQIDTNNQTDIIDLLQDESLNFDLNENFFNSYYESFKSLRTKYNESSKEIASQKWLRTTTLNDKYEFYFNLNDQRSFSWIRPDTFVPSTKLLTRKMIAEELGKATEESERYLLYKRNEHLIILLQSNMRGYLARKCIRDRLQYLGNHAVEATKIQAWWRMVLERRAYLNRRKYLKENEKCVIILQSYVRMWLQRRKYLARLKYFSDNEKAVIKIQSFVRGSRARHDYKSLIHDKNPSLSTVRKFVHLLEHNNLDFTEEIELQELKKQVIVLIKLNKNLEQDLDMMDVKIGLLVKNRITLQDVLMQHKKLKKYKEDIELNQTKHIKQLNKENHEKLELYQNLFYLLQTNPVYLAKLLFVLPLTNTSKFIESVVLELFNYASNSREEYLLLNLLTTALQEEIESRVDKISDIITGTPLVIKVIVSLYRKHKGENVLGNLFGAQIKEIINDKKLQLCLNPCEIYRNWINRIETESGKATGYPYDVTNQKALEYKEVRDQLEENIELVKMYTTKFQQLIINSIDKIPYGLRYIAKVLRNTLRAKFPQTNERDILKIIGNLIYYRFINSALCQPDAYDIIDMETRTQLDTDQRRNLACIAKHLQLISMSKGYGDTENAHLACLNSFIKESHERMRNYFSEICNVQDSDEYFGIDEFSDLIVLTKPVVYITIQEIYDTHKILIEYLDKIAPNENDPLHEILNALGNEPHLDTLTDNVSFKHINGSYSSSVSNDTINTRDALNNTQICLTLTNRYTPIKEEKTDLNNLFIRTKRFIVDILNCQSGDNLIQILESPTTKEQETLHLKLLSKREKADRLINSTVDNVRLSKTFNTSLDVMKKEVKQNLVDLENAGMVSSKNNYQVIMSRIAQDIRNQRKHRQRRQEEIAHLQEVLKVLGKKNNLLKEQVSYYNEYVKACLENHNNSNKKRSKNPFKKSKVEQKTEPIKYTAAKLYEKGVILEIEGVQPNQFKNVIFEIIPTDEPGVFEVAGKFMHVQMDRFELIFQDLLQLQYEGKTIMKMFDRAKINVNLLIFLINKKFYGK